MEREFVKNQVLNILGRSAQFQYIHTHDLFDSAEKTIHNLIKKGIINGYKKSN